MQLDYNEAKVDFEAQQFALEQRVLELEAARVEQVVTRDEHAASLDERDRLNAEVLSSQQAVQRLREQLKDVQEQVGRGRGTGPRWFRCNGAALR
jgi:uncharacterized protein (DUF3084 family)